MKKSKPDYWSLGLGVLWLVTGLALASAYPHITVGYGILCGFRISQFFDSIGGK